MCNYASFSVCTFMSSALRTTEVHACHACRASMLTTVAPSFILDPSTTSPSLLSCRDPFYKLRKQPHFPAVLFHETINTQPQIVFGPLTMQMQSPFASVSEESVHFRNLTSSKVQGCIGNQMHWFPFWKLYRWVRGCPLLIYPKSFYICFQNLTHSERSHSVDLFLFCFFTNLSSRLLQQCFSLAVAPKSQCMKQFQMEIYWQK